MRLIRRFIAIPDIKTGESMQKFYKSAGIVKTTLGFQILLDGRPIKTPEKQPFIVPTEALGIEIALEWQDQDKFILQNKMPLVSTTLDELSMCWNRYAFHSITSDNRQQAH